MPNPHFTQNDRDDLVNDRRAKVFRKRARIMARQMAEDFSVDTDRGTMVGHTGDWLATNHPDDDPGSDLWTISDERMASTYDAD